MALTAIAKAIINIVMTVASVAYQAAQQKKMKKAMDARKGFEFTVSGESAPLPVVYGKQIIGGVATSRKVTTGFQETSSTEDTLFAEGLATTAVTGTKSEFLHVQYALCQGGIEGVQSMLVNGLAYDDAEAGFKHRIRIFNDGPIPVSSSFIAMGFPENNRFTGAASSTATFRLNRDDYNYNGEPSVQFLMKGRKVRAVELNTGVYSLSTSWVYSNNPVLVLLDYMTNAEFGRGLPVAKLDLESFYNAAAVCDTVVTSGRSIGGLVNGGPGTRDIPLYECNITLDTEATIRENIERILETMGFAEMMWSPEGRYKLTLDYPTSLAATNALIPSTHVFTDDNILRDEVALSWLSASQRSNQATVNFMNEHEDFKEDSMTWPVFGSATYNTYLTEDNQQPLRKNLQVAGITDPYHALARAEQEVRKSRQLFTVEFTADKQALSVEIGDLIKLTLSTSGLTDEIFKVNAMEVRADMSVKISAYSFSHEMLAWNVNDDIAYATRPTYDFSIDAPVTASFTSEVSDVLGTASGKLSWVPVTAGSSTQYLIELSADDGVTWQTLGTTRDSSFDVTGLKTGFYDFSIRAQSPLGTLSSRLLLPDQTIQLKTVGKVAVIYADTGTLATNTQSYDLNLNTFVAYYEHDGDRPTLPLRAGLEFTEFVGDPGSDAPRFASRTLYTNPAVATPVDATPSATITWSTGALSGITSGWSLTPPTHVASSTNKVWSSELSFIDTTAPFSTSAATGSTAVIGTSFSGLVTFTGGDFAVDGATITSIEGGNIATNTITASEIAANTITASEISSGYIYAGTIDADNINAGTLNVDRLPGLVRQASSSGVGYNTTSVSLTGVTAGSTVIGFVSSAASLGGTQGYAEIAATMTGATSIGTYKYMVGANTSGSATRFLSDNSAAAGTVTLTCTTSGSNVSGGSTTNVTLMEFIK